MRTKIAVCVVGVLLGTGILSRAPAAGLKIGDEETYAKIAMLLQFWSVFTDEGAPDPDSLDTDFYDHGDRERSFYATGDGFLSEFPFVSREQAENGLLVVIHSPSPGFLAACRGELHFRHFMYATSTAISSESRRWPEAT